MPLFSCLQDTYLLPEHHLHFHEYACYRKDTGGDIRGNGGFGILVRDSVHSQEICTSIHSSSCAVKITVTPFFHCLFLVSSSWSNLICNRLFDLFSDLSTPFVVVCDFSTHNSIWDSSRTCQSGALLEQLLLANNLVFLNRGESTHMCRTIGSKFSIDLTLCN